LEFTEFMGRIDTVTTIIHKKLNTIFANDAEPQITPPYIKVLSVISNAGTCTMSDIAGEMGVSLSAVTALADRLEEYGLIERGRGSKDRRIVQVKINKTGKEVLKRKEAVLFKLLGKCFATITPEEMDICVRIMDKIAQSLNEE
jgi:DNA-binding MarR family transcriptional regulator